LLVFLRFSPISFKFATGRVLGSMRGYALTHDFAGIYASILKCKLGLLSIPVFL
jgi:hypothetical protein